ncbi:MAG: hypothetical protein KAI63_08025 [Planctomycetes bacterium]|nr:hypothetical protein [Planctomycetota bacterium]
MNQNMMPEPDLAKSWDISEDGMTYTFYLREGVRFHDGVEFTSEDVSFTYHLLRKHKTFSPSQVYFDVVKKWEVINKYTFRVLLNKPFGLSVTTLNEPIIPKHLLENQDVETANFNRSPVGTGPFRFKEWTNDNTIVLEANPDYYEGRPHLDRIEARGYETQQQVWTAFMKGETDIAFFLSKENFEIAKRDPHFKTYTFPYIWTYALEYNPDHRLVKDKTVRQAIAHAINIPEIIHKLEGGYGEPSTGPFIPKTWWYNPEVKPLEYAPAKAQKLLASAGWKLNKNDILEKDGREFRLLILVNSDVREYQQMAMLIHNDLFQLGIRTKLIDFNSNKFLSGEIQPLENAAAYLNVFTVMPDPAESSIYWHSKEKRTPRKLWLYKNPEVDRLFDLGQMSADAEKQRTIYQEIHRLVYNDQAATFLYFFYNLSATQSKFENTDQLFSSVMPFWTIKEWRVKEEVGSR